MDLIVTIDTEEDNWADFMRTGYTLDNIGKIPDLQSLFDEYRIKPTYLINYPVATNRKAAYMFKEILGRGLCEIGTHCHPWNTPPFEEEISRNNSMLCNLPTDLQFEKLRVLRDVIRENCDVDPVSFRAGRWGFDYTVAGNIQRLGYKIDSSVTPYMDWTSYGGPDFSFHSPDIFEIPLQAGKGKEEKKLSLTEVPVTIGFLQKDFHMSHRIYRFLEKQSIRRTRLIGILDRLRLLNKIWLSPELSGTREMIEITESFKKKGYAYVNMTFHSPSLIPGCSPFVKTEKDSMDFLQKIRDYFQYVSECRIGSIFLSEIDVTRQ